MEKAHGFLKFERDEDEPYEFIYDVYNKRRQELGEIHYNSKWRKHVFEPHGGTYYDADCSKQISEFLSGLDEGEALHDLIEKRGVKDKPKSG